MSCDLHKSDISLICFKPKCSQTRLSCLYCVVEKHTDHANECIFIDEIINTYPNEPIPQKEEFTLSNDLAIIQPFEGVIERATNIFDNLKYLIDQFIDDQVPKEIQQKEIEFQQAFIAYTNKQWIKERFFLFLKNELTQKELNDQLTDHVQNNKQVELRNNIIALKKQLDGNSLKCQKSDLNFLKVQLSQFIQHIPSTLMSNNSLALQINQGKKGKISNGNQFYTPKCDETFTVMTTNSFKYPDVKEFKVIFTKYDSQLNSAQQCFIGFTKSKNPNQNSLFQNGVTALFGLNNLSKSNGALQNPDGKYLGEAIKEQIQEQTKAVVEVSINYKVGRIQLSIANLKCEFDKKKGIEIYGEYQLIYMESFFEKGSSTRFTVYGSGAEIGFYIE